MLSDIQGELLLIERQELLGACFIRHLLLVPTIYRERLLVVMHRLVVISQCVLTRACTTTNSGECPLALLVLHEFVALSSPETCPHACCHIIQQQENCLSLVDLSQKRAMIQLFLFFFMFYFHGIYSALNCSEPEQL